MMRRPFVAVLFGLSTSPAFAVEPAYCELDLGACKVLEVFEEGVGAALECGGIDEIPIFVTEGDLRFDVDFGAPNGTTETFGPFNSVGDRVEWRRETGEPPFAAILRFAIEDPEGGTAPADKGSVLGIFKVEGHDAPGCPIAYVDAQANEGANEIARQVADAFARPFRCGTDRATYVGRVGPRSGSATATYEPR